MTEPGVATHIRSSCRSDAQHFGCRRGILEIDRQIDGWSDSRLQLGQGGKVRWERYPVDGPDGDASSTPPDNAVVVDHGHTVSGEPHVGLQCGRTHASSGDEGVEGVLRRVGSGATVREAHDGLGHRCTHVHDDARDRELRVGSP